LAIKHGSPHCDFSQPNKRPQLGGELRPVGLLCPRRQAQRSKRSTGTFHLGAAF
jgi:hypothetical protein